MDARGSTTMVIQSKTVNKPSNQTGQRPVSDAILIFPKPKVAETFVDAPSLHVLNSSLFVA